MKTRLALLLLTTLLPAIEALAEWNPRPGWKDSYAVAGRCYCDSNGYDHNLDEKSAVTPIGRLNVVRICADIKARLGEGPREGRIPYNDIQCGHGPANDAADEAGCPGRVDIGSRGCDIKGPRWDLEAVYGDGSNTDSEPQPEPQPEPEPQPQPEPAATGPGDADSSGGTDTSGGTAGAGAIGDTESADSANDMPTQVADGTCTSPLADSLGAAKAAFASSCPTHTRRDCDRMSNRQWQCSSAVIGRSSPRGPITTTSRPSSSSGAAETPRDEERPASEPALIDNTGTSPSAEAPPIQPPATSPAGNNASCQTSGASLASARRAFVNDCPTFNRRDCDRLSGDRWLCSSDVIGRSAPGGTVAGSTTTPDRPATSPPATGTGTSGTDPSSSGTTSVGRLAADDLVALHYDNCPDRDDGHAVVAGKAVVSTLGLENVLVVNGTCGDAVRSRYQPSSVDVLRATWGDSWLDGFGQRDASVNRSADAWAAVLSNGGKVWVADGGPSDFTARVLRQIGERYPSVDRKRVHVIQHSHGGGFNESNTSSANIALVRNEATYITIANGNQGPNGTAKLNQVSSSFVLRARASRLAAAWEAAFDYLNPSRRLDFSDTVELLYIVNDTETQTVNEFASRYL